ncbi:ABC transporter ATP-binding protein [Lacticaseibacillus baoqingensis]|uniref:ABC transporter ATP-binding protein n=1 Tax=Lacticaseibacillus baoqingensis TaxID=2486013 RepID=A0ABW4E266_9LACO|nr:ABC transporter ATP-binding protein [Lacticaseibacillus baoqingensis]
MEIEHLSFAYPKTTTPQLDDVSFTLKPGQLTSLIGPNGSGKSTLFNVLTRQLVPTAGTVSIDGQAIADFSARAYAQKVAAVQQHNPLYDDLSVQELIRFGQSAYHFPLSEAADEAVIDEIMAFLQLTGLKKRSMQALSGGQQQRVWLALALAQQPEYLLLDEPTTYLDLHFQFRFLQLLKQLNQQKHLTILIILHDLNQALAFSDHTLLLANGKLAAQGAPQAVVTPANLKTYFAINSELVATSSGQQIVQLPD